MQDASPRNLPNDAAKKLRPGAEHYTAYVGPPTQWDFMGATQFRLLTALGLREHHKLLDVGCGSLRAGRILIPYLLPGNYYGIEPNRWLVEEAITREIGSEIVRMRCPSFLYASDFSVDAFGVAFDFIVAQSIFSHAGPDIVALALSQFAKTLSPSGLVLATFVHPERLPSAPQEALGWTYPGCTTYPAQHIDRLISDAGLIGRSLPWFHPRQTWYAMAISRDAMPPQDLDRHLSGVVLRDPEFRGSDAATI